MKSEPIIVTFHMPTWILWIAGALLMAGAGLVYVAYFASLEPPKVINADVWMKR